MRVRAFLPLLCLCAIGVAAPADEQPPERGANPRPVDYLREVKPLLARRCTTCHGALRQNSGLRLDAGTLVREGGDSGPAVVPGKPEESLLIEAVTGRSGFPLMPKEGGPLSKDEIALLERWIAEGAVSPADEPIEADPRQHWAFRMPRRPDVPSAGRADWPRNPVDALLAARRHARELPPADEAPKGVLLRRVFIDLIGLPPTIDELREFLGDGSPDAYEKVVDRLLASPHYGERWGRHWMDVWRYSDWYGYRNELRNSARHIWRWRDWIIESLNADRPYDRMVLEMLAADELTTEGATGGSPARGRQETLRATGFLVRNYYKFNRHTWLDATIEHTGKAFLGLTINCARCHDHMYDPISQREYYQFRAIFEPHDVRTDRVPGEPDVVQDGVPRAYDATLDAQTFLFERGDDKRPDKDHPLEPGVPQAVASDAAFAVQAVSLPKEAWYPGLLGFIQQETLEAARAAARHGRMALGEARDTLAERQRHFERIESRLRQPVAAPRPGEPLDVPETTGSGPPASVSDATDALRESQATVRVLKSRLAAAESVLAAAEARIAADRARFDEPPARDAGEQIRVAARLEQIADARQAEAELAAAELNLSSLEGKARGDRPGKAVQDARAKLEAARKAVARTRQALELPADSYTPLGPAYPRTSSGRRLALARWIIDERNPLTARVAVNHVWLRHFGSALVPSVFDFGRNGSPPTHPALLDWLAVELMSSAGPQEQAADIHAADHGPPKSGDFGYPRTTDHEHLANPQSPGWRLKRLHRLLVTSAAYRLASTAPEDHPGWSLDRDNRLLWRTDPRRMEAEAVRDSALAVAANLDRRMGGPEIDEQHAETRPRRSVYFRHAPEKHVPFLTMFDSASTNECYRRVETVVPQQALAMTNSRLIREQSRRLAGMLSDRLQTSESESSEASDAAFIHSAFEELLCRPPTPAEVTACEQFLREQSTRLADPAGLTPVAAGGDASPQGLAPAADPRSRARENLIHVLLNHNEFITIR